MSEPSSPTLAGERTFRFISDPGHKENLSGRVRAACLTCRRKKIKCSGEINCRTCREKGLVCEGLPERKRPSRDGGSSIVLDPVPGGIERKRKISPPKKPVARRPSILKAIRSTDSNDSGYISYRGDSLDTLASPTTSESIVTPNAGAGSTFDVPIRQPVSTREPGHTGLHIDTWHLSEPQPESTSDVLYSASTIEPPSGISPNGQAASTSVSQQPLDWPPMQTNDAWWLNQTTDSDEQLMSAAQALEDQAQSLRMMARRPHPPEHHNQASRRQTIAFPLEPPSAFEPRYDLLQNQQGVFDDMALLFANRTPGTGLTPNLTEFSSWWEINGVGDLATVFGDTSTAILPPSGGDAEQAPPPYEETETSSSTLGGTRRPDAADASYFDQYHWPD